jgi:hypothetical protein
MGIQRAVLKAIRKLSLDETVGKRPHLYEHKLGKIRKYPMVVQGIPTQVPVQLYHFTLHPECTRAVYRAHKRSYLKNRARKHITQPKHRYITGFGSRARARGQEYGPSHSDA